MSNRSSPISSREGAPPAGTWQQMLADAATAEEVIALCRDHLARFDHSIVARLPDPCRPRKLLDSHDVASYAYDLVRHECASSDPEISELINSLSNFFSRAMLRLSQLAAPSPAQNARLFG